jgi:hypothetical protein
MELPNGFREKFKINFDARAGDSESSVEQINDYAVDAFVATAKEFEVEFSDNDEMCKSYQQLLIGVFVPSMPYTARRKINKAIARQRAKS